MSYINNSSDIEDIEEKLNQLEGKKNYNFIYNFTNFLLYNFRFILFFTLILIWQILSYFKVEYSNSFLDLMLLIILGSELNKKFLRSILFFVTIVIIGIILIISYFYKLPHEFFSLLLIMLIIYKIQDSRAANKIKNNNSEK
jgi:hypothetical protein